MGIFIKYTHENEIIWSQQRVQANPPDPPLPSGSVTGSIYSADVKKADNNFRKKNIGEIRVKYVQKAASEKTGLSHPFLGMGPGPMELGKLAAF